MQRLKDYRKYLRIWLSFSHASFQEAILLNPFSALFFLLGKSVRFFSFFFFLYVLIGQSKNFLGYTQNEVILFYLVYNLVDISAQAFFRGVYWFRGTILSGYFDHFLLKPIHPLFNVLTRYTDFLDVFTLIPLLIYFFYFLAVNNMLSFFSLFLFFLAFACGMTIAFSFHVLSMAVGVITTEVDSIIWMYRNLIGMGRVPVDAYVAPIRFILTYLVPVAVMTTIPAKLLAGLDSPLLLLISLSVAGAFLAISLSCWRWALTKYSSASS